MDDKNLHINDYLKRKYPEPDIPVDKAWENMNALLDAEICITRLYNVAD